MTLSRQRVHEGGVQHVLDYLKRMQGETPNFYYALESDHDHSNGNIFWVDGVSRMNYSYFGDTVVLDTSYRANGYKVPFVTFTGLNHHGDPVLFGCGLMFNESDVAYVWLVRSWLHAMSGRCPLSITTEPDPVVQMAVSQVLPETRHRYSKWSILRESHSNLAQIYKSHPNFETMFRKCINETETIEEFESQWESMLRQYYLMDNEWMQSMYNVRHQWVPVYLRGTFFGDMSTTEGNDGKNLYFDGFVNANTTIQVLIKHYEKATASWLEKELKADDNTSNMTPVLKTPSPMEKHAAILYTRKIFMKFREELVETLANPATKIEDLGAIATYQVAKFGETHKVHVVHFSALETKASCSCQMFEFSGIICRHILSVFRAKNVLTLPSQYILKRWTRNAKNGGGLEEHASEVPSDSRDSLTVRYNSLRQVAIKFIEEGAKSVHVYNVAVDALREATKQVTAVKDRGPGPAESGTPANDSNQVHAGGEDRALSSQSKEEKEKQIHELTAQLEGTNRRCEVYRSNLLAVLKAMEDQKLKLSVKVQNARLSLKE